MYRVQVPDFTFGNAGGWAQKGMLFSITGF